MDHLSEMIVNISKAGAYDIVSKQVIELKEENTKLKDRVKYLEDLIIEYTERMKQNIETIKIN